MASEVDEVSDSAGEATLALRQCGRCRKLFEGDANLHPKAQPEWWACQPCRESLFGDRPRQADTNRASTRAAHRR